MNVDIKIDVKKLLVISAAVAGLMLLLAAPSRAQEQARSMPAKGRPQSDEGYQDRFQRRCAFLGGRLHRLGRARTNRSWPWRFWIGAVISSSLTPWKGRRRTRSTRRC